MTASSTDRRDIYAEITDKGLRGLKMPNHSNRRRVTTAYTAADAEKKYLAALQGGLLVQKCWRRDNDGNGRILACALGVLGPNILDPMDCPSTVMPTWLAKMVPWFFDNQKPGDAFAWGARFYAALKALDGKVPFAVIHDWHANVVGPLAVVGSSSAEAHKTLAALHARALAGDVAGEDEWMSALRPAFADIYIVHGNDNANAWADAEAYSRTKASAYTYTYTYANGVTNAAAGITARRGDTAAYTDAMALVANGMVDCLERAANK